MGMQAPALSLLVAAALLTAPARVFAGALDEARGVSSDAAGFDGARDRRDDGLVRAGSDGDRRERRLGKGERLSDTRGNLTAATPGPDAEPKAKEKNKWVNWPLAQSAMQGALLGLLLGSLFFPIGLIVGPIVGAAIFYGMAKHAADKAAKEDS
jgi:hypothetical protein